MNKLFKLESHEYIYMNEMGLEITRVISKSPFFENMLFEFVTTFKENERFLKLFGDQYLIGLFTRECYNYGAREFKKSGLYRLQINSAKPTSTITFSPLSMIRDRDCLLLPKELPKSFDECFTFESIDSKWHMSIICYFINTIAKNFGMSYIKTNHSKENNSDKYFVFFEKTETQKGIQFIWNIQKSEKIRIEYHGSEKTYARLQVCLKCASVEINDSDYDAILDFKDMKSLRLTFPNNFETAKKYFKFLLKENFYKDGKFDAELFRGHYELLTEISKISEKNESQLSISEKISKEKTDNFQIIFQSDFNSIVIKYAAVLLMALKKAFSLLDGRKLLTKKRMQENILQFTFFNQQYANDKFEFIWQSMPNFKRPLLLIDGKDIYISKYMGILIEYQVELTEGAGDASVYSKDKFLHNVEFKLDQEIDKSQISIVPKTIDKNKLMNYKLSLELISQYSQNIEKRASFLLKIFKDTFNLILRYRELFPVRLGKCIHIFWECPESSASFEFIWEIRRTELMAGEENTLKITADGNIQTIERYLNGLIMKGLNKVTSKPDLVFQIAGKPLVKEKFKFPNLFDAETDELVFTELPKYKI